MKTIIPSTVPMQLLILNIYLEIHFNSTLIEHLSYYNKV